MAIKPDVIIAETLRIPVLSPLSGEQNNNVQPNATGIIAVPEELSKYPQNPTKIKIKEFKKFALYEFIIIF